MNDINAAMTTIARDTRQIELQKQWLVIAHPETTWLKANGNTITLGYLKNQLPYCTQNDDGEMEGSLASLATTLHDKFGITVKTIALSNNRQMIKALFPTEPSMSPCHCFATTGSPSRPVIQSNSMGTVSLTAIHSGKEQRP